MPEDIAKSSSPPAAEPESTSLTPAQIDLAVDRYRANVVAYAITSTGSAWTAARTAAPEVA